MTLDQLWNHCRLHTAMMLFILTSPFCMAENLAIEQFVGRWQVDRLMQPHKLPYYPLDCGTASNVNEITMLTESRIHITDGKQATEYDVSSENGQYFFQGKRRTTILLEAPGETFLHAVGVHWYAYRRCAD